MTRKFGLILCCVFVPAIRGADAPAARDPLTLDHGQIYEMTREGKHWTARVYVTPQPSVAEHAVVTLRGITYGTRSDPALTALFPAPRRIPDKGPITAFDIATRDDAAVPRGTYDVLLTVTAAALKPQSLTVQAVVPGATLKQPPALLISRVVNLWGPADGYSPPVLLAETGQKSPVSLTIFQQDHFSDSADVYNGQLLFSAARLEPGKCAALPYQLQGEFPLGSSKANLEIRAAEIDSPLSVAVEVRTRRTRWLLLIILIGGLALGFLMRNVLKQRIQFGEAREKAFATRRKLADERDDVPDTTFHEEVNQAIRALEAAILQARINKADSLTAAVASAEQSLSTAQDHLHKGAEAVAQELAALALVVKTSWRLPQPVLDALAGAAAELDKVAEKNKAQNVTAARESLDKARATLAEWLGGYARSWKGTAGEALDNLGRVHALLLAEARKDFDDRVRSAQTTVEAVDDRLEGDSPATIKTLLTALDNAQETARITVRQARTGVLEAFGAMSLALEGVAVPDPAAWKQAGRDTADFARLLREAEAGLEVASDLGAEVDALLFAWMQAMKVQGADPKTMDLMRNGQYREAAASLVQSLTPKETLQGDEERTPGGRAIAVGLGGAAVALARSEKVEAPPEPALFEAFYPPKRKKVTFDVLAAKSLRDLMRARWLLSLLSALGLALVGYLVFADKFVGTSGDLMAAFFWGFTTDIGLDALISVGTKKKTAES